ncbi:TPA: helix-turn-helix domain-containing protein [Bacillus cereus]
MKKARHDRNIFNLIHTTGSSLPGISNYSILTSLIKNFKFTTKAIKDDIFQQSNLELRDYLKMIRSYLNLKNANIAENANISEAYFKDILNGRRLPSRDTVLGLCFGLELNLDESHILLKKAGFNEFYLRDKRDYIIASCIEHEKDIHETNDLLIVNKLHKIGK